LLISLRQNWLKNMVEMPRQQLKSAFQK
jgi:hypothetical protein